jgi:signal transduction histidine kinase
MSGAHLMAIINDVLDLTKIESNSMVLTKETVDIRKAVQSVASICKHGLKGGKDVQFNLNISDRVPQYIMVDVTRLKQIFMNFLSNAYKFTNKGTITLKVDARSSDQHPEKEAWKEEGAPFYLYIEVEDTGIGMDKEKLSDLFKPFSQLDNSSTRQFTGSGLGLAISFHLARMMNGKGKNLIRLSSYL